MTHLVTTSPSAKPARRYKFRQAIQTDVGLKREENQDAYGYAHTSRVSIFVVADGMGGARGGATASALAVDAILRGAIDENGNVTEISLREAIIAANTLIFEHSAEDESLAGMGTTVVVLAFAGDKVLVAHVGDSRIYRFRGGKVMRLTRDHTLVQELVDSGSISPDEAANHPISHMLTRSLGPSPEIEVDVHTLPQNVEEKDRFLLCSDGLYNLVSQEEMEGVVAKEEIQGAVQKLIELVLERGAPDNVTLEAVEALDLGDESFKTELPDEGKIRVVTSGSFESDEIESQRKRGSASDGAAKSKAAPASPAVDSGIKEAGQSKNGEGAAQRKSDGAPDTAKANGTSHEAAPGSIAEDVPAGARISPVVTWGAVLTLVAVLVGIVLNQGTTEPAKKESPVQETAVQAPVETPAPPQPGAQPAVPDETSEEEFLAELRSSGRKNWPKAGVIPEGGTGEGAAPQVVTPPQEESAGPPPPPPAETALPPPVEMAKAGPDAVPLTSAGSVVPAVNPVVPPRLGTVEEQKEISASKQRIQDQIADIDANLLLFELTSPERLRLKRVEVDTKLKVLKNDIDALSRRKVERERQLSQWRERQRTFGDRDALALANEIAGDDPAVRKRRDELQLTQQRFEQAVHLFDESEGDPEATKAVTALGRERNIQQTYLEQAVRAGIDAAIGRLSAESVDLAIQIEDQRRLEERLNRHLGILDTARPKSTAAADRQLQRNLFQERAKLSDKLMELRNQMSDDEELAFRRGQALSAAGGTAPDAKSSGL